MQLRSRAILVLIFLACGFTVVSSRLIEIQYVEHEKYRLMAVANHLRAEVIPQKRGSILDCDGAVLAQAQPTWEISIDSTEADAPQVCLPKIASILDVPEATLAADYNAQLYVYVMDAKTGIKMLVKNHHICLARGVWDEVASKLRDSKVRGLVYEERDVRCYPNRELAAHVIGYLDEKGQGKAGMEREMDTLMTGAPGKRWVERDAKHHEIAGYQVSETPATDGCDVTLTIKLHVQHAVEEALDQIELSYQPDAAYIVVMDPHTGEIWAMASRPTFDPSDNRTFKEDQLRNRCITDPVEPGSIFKIITLAGALNEKLVKLSTPIFCENGSFFYAGKYLKDDEPNGTLPVIEVMAQSSNIGFAKIALNYLHEQKLYDYARAFGIHSLTGLFHRQGESAGKLEPVKDWSALSITRIPMGQEVEATPIQLVTAMSVIANGGLLMAPHLIKQVADHSGRVIEATQPKVVRRVISPDAAREVTKALEQVAIDGTAKNIHIDGYSFAGKTGTAQKVVDKTYSHTEHVSSFIGFVPVEDPAFVALVMVNNPKTAKDYGAEVSAPVFASLSKQIAQIINLPPDKPLPAPTVLSATNPATL